MFEDDNVSYTDDVENLSHRYSVLHSLYQVSFLLRTFTNKPTPLRFKADCFSVPILYFLSLHLWLDEFSASVIPGAYSI